jgi:hypothetical protein
MAQDEQTDEARIMAPAHNQGEAGPVAADAEHVPITIRYIL